jgi:MoaA/NifB/PqqE/SkfB family radical SAM enzyme
MNPRIVKVSPTKEYFSITWRLTTRCNYDCMYCPTKWHDTTSQQHTLSELQQYWRDIYSKSQHKNLKYKISFTGGELTTNRDFLPFVTWLSTTYQDNIFQILVTTNGSATTKYYCRMFEYVDNISFSLHSEHVDEQKFFNMIQELKESISPKKFIHVNIMNEFWNQDRITMYKKLLDNLKVSHSINELDYDLKTRETPAIKGKLNLEI